VLVLLADELVLPVVDSTAPFFDAKQDLFVGQISLVPLLLCAPLVVARLRSRNAFVLGL
jgi:hypothetical protein